jgi:hypothetical protein
MLCVSSNLGLIRDSKHWLRASLEDLYTHFTLFSSSVTGLSFDHLSNTPSVEGLYCKRPIQCLASSEILTPPPPPHRPASVYGADGRIHSLSEEGVGGQ